MTSKTEDIGEKEALKIIENKIDEKINQKIEDRELHNEEKIEKIVNKKKKELINARRLENKKRKQINLINNSLTVLLKLLFLSVIIGSITLLAKYHTYIIQAI